MSNEVIQIFLIAIIIIIIILILILAYIFYKDKRDKQKEEEQTEPINTDNQPKQDRKSIFRFMEFDEIEDNMIVQDGGSRYLMVVECKGVNYDLLSGVEKTSIEQGFIQFLNTLRHEIQLYIQTRKVNLNQSVTKYKERLERIRLDLQTEEEKYRDLERKPGVTKDELLREIKRVTQKRNLYEYGKDIIENTEQMAENRDITTKQYYVVIPYYTEEITSSGDFDKKEISSMAFSELYTRAQAIVSGLMGCDVRGKILNSQELVELLYVAYNREQYDIYDFETYMNDSGYQSLYSVSQDVLEKRIIALNEEISQKANRKAVDAFEYATEEVKAKARIVKDREEHMDQYVDELANQIVDSEENVMGKDLAKRTKDRIKEMSDKKKKIDNGSINNSSSEKVEEYDDADEVNLDDLDENENIQKTKTKVKARNRIQRSIRNNNSNRQKISENNNRNIANYDADDSTDEDDDINFDDYADDDETYEDNPDINTYKPNNNRDVSSNRNNRNNEEDEDDIDFDDYADEEDDVDDSQNQDVDDNSNEDENVDDDDINFDDYADEEDDSDESQNQNGDDNANEDDIDFDDYADDDGKNDNSDESWNVDDLEDDDKIDDDEIYDDTSDEDEESEKEENTDLDDLEDDDVVTKPVKRKSSIKKKQDLNSTIRRTTGAAGSKKEMKKNKK